MGIQSSIATFKKKKIVFNRNYKSQFSVEFLHLWVLQLIPNDNESTLWTKWNNWVDCQFLTPRWRLSQRRCMSRSWKGNIMRVIIKLLVQWAHGGSKMTASSLSLLPSKHAVYFSFPCVWSGPLTCLDQQHMAGVIVSLLRLGLMSSAASTFAPWNMPPRTQSPCCEEAQAATGRDHVKQNRGSHTPSSGWALAGSHRQPLVKGVSHFGTSTHPRALANSKGTAINLQNCVSQ